MSNRGEALLTECTPLTTGERCADWFVLRRFGLTGTTVARVLKADPAVRALLGMGPIHDPVRTILQWIEELANRWFSTRRGTESMARRSVNEDAVKSALLGLPAVVHIAPVGLVARRSES